MARWQSRHHDPDDPTGELAAYADLLETARRWVHEVADADEQRARQALLADAELEYAGRRANPSAGRLSQLDEGFRALGYHDRDRD